MPGAPSQPMLSLTPRASWMSQRVRISPASYSKLRLPYRHQPARHLRSRERWWLQDAEFPPATCVEQSILPSSICIQAEGRQYSFDGKERCLSELVRLFQSAVFRLAFRCALCCALLRCAPNHRPLPWPSRTGRASILLSLHVFGLHSVHSYWSAIARRDLMPRR